MTREDIRALMEDLARKNGGQVTDASMSFAKTRPVAVSTHTYGSREISC